MFPQPPVPITKPTLLVVEGADDKSFFEALSMKMNLSNVEVRELRGGTNLNDYLAALPGLSGFSTVRSLGIVKDADLKTTGDMFRSISSNLRQAGLPVPTDVGKTSAETDGRFVTVFVFEKTAQLPGMLETVCLEAFAGESDMSCVEDYFKCLTSQLTPTQLQKARMQVFLASKGAYLRFEIAVKQSWWP